MIMQMAELGISSLTGLKAEEIAGKYLAVTSVRFDKKKFK
jgi:hypothetical protein